MTTDLKTMVIYHGKCLDGFTAAWVANWALSLQSEPPQEWVVDAVPAQYGDAPPDVTDREVFIVDFSYPPEVLREMADKALRVRVIDHHKTAIEKLEGFDHPDVVLHLSTERSGAYLAWEYFFGDQHVPSIVEYVDDRDRWVFNNVDTKPFNEALFSYPQNPASWAFAYTSPHKLVEDGHAFLRKQEKDIKASIEAGLMIGEIGGFSVPTVNTAANISETCHTLLHMFPDAPFAATWWVRSDGKQVWSLRSRNESDVDVAAIAQRYGGGGHKHAAGFTGNKVEVDK